MIINCTVKVHVSSRYTVDFYRGSQTRLTNDGVKYLISQPYVRKDPGDLLYSLDDRQLTIKNVQRKDTGRYMCKIEDHNGYSNENFLDVTILTSSESKLEMRTKEETILCDDRLRCQFIVNYKSYPEPSFRIYHNDQQLMTDSQLSGSHKTMIDIKRNESEIVITRQEAVVEDSGNYTIEATNGQLTKNITVQVFVRAKPIVHLEPSQIYVKLGEKGRLRCNVLGYPKSIFEWSFIKCPAKDWQFCTRNIPVSNRDGFDTTNTVYVPQPRSTNTPTKTEVNMHFDLVFIFCFFEPVLASL